MGKKDPRVDAYIAKSADFAKPILIQIRRVVHANCAEIEETMKWGMPSFTYEGILCGMAAFKAHATFGFWHKGMNQELPKEFLKLERGMGQFGRMTSVNDLPDDKTFAKLIVRAMKLNEEKQFAVPAPKPKKKSAPPKVPADLIAALKKNKKAKEAFEKFSYSHKKEYIEWITEAKREETRLKRLETTIQWLTSGKSRNWKYEGC